MRSALRSITAPTAVADTNETVRLSVPFPSPRATAALALIVILVLALAPTARAGTANAGIPGAPASNPLSGLPWGDYTGSLDGVYPAYQKAQGRDKTLLGKIALKPLTYWFGAWDSDNTVKRTIQTYLAYQTGGQSNVLAQFAVFRLNPWEQKACTNLPGAAARASYKRWIDHVAAAIGSTRVALILQPDLPFALCPPHHRGSNVQLGLVRYAARRFNSLPHTTVYIDVGAGDWESASQAVWLLKRAGERYTRGFSLNDTHFDSTGNELRFGAEVVRLLAHAGIPGKHFVINTAENGSPFLYYKYHGHGDPPACGTTSSKMCASLGIPPTTDVANPAWGLSSKARSIAASEADAYMWIGRPWLDNGSYPFDPARAEAMAASSPF